MAFTSTANLDTYKNNLDILGDKSPSLKTFVDELQAGSVNYDLVNGTTQQAVGSASYISNNASLVTITLPATSSVGQRLSVVGNGAGGWRVAQNAGQQINKSATATTTGTGGSLSSANRYDTAHLVCTVANTTWVFSHGNGAHVLA